MNLNKDKNSCQILLGYPGLDSLHCRRLNAFSGFDMWIISFHSERED